MHILEIPSFFPPFGGAFCLEQTKALKGIDHEVRVLSLTQIGMSSTPRQYFSMPYRTTHFCMENVEVIQRFQRDIPRMTRYNQQRYCHTLKQMFDEYVKQYGKPDVIHAHCCQWAGVAAWMISRDSGIPFFITEHLSSMIFKANYDAGWTRNVWAKELLTQAYQAANCVIPVSKELVDDIAPFFGRDYRWQEISNIIDTDFFHFRQRQPLDGRKFRFCCLAVSNGYNFHLKGYDVLAEAFRNIEGAELHIAGIETDGQRMQQAFSHNANVHLHGHLTKEEVRDLLYYCDALVFPSRSEAQGLVILEALSTGIPVVTTDAIPRNAIVEDGCLIAKAGDADSLRIKMLKCMYIQPSESFSIAVKSVASPEKIARKIENIICKTSYP